MEPANILVIEDDYIVARTIERSLRNDAFVVTLASRGEKGMYMARQNRPDLVILDIIMPDMDGYQVCRAMRADPQLADIPVLFLTARVKPQDRINGFRIGADDYLCKPFNVDELIMRVKAILRRTMRRSNDQPAEASTPAEPQAENTASPAGSDSWGAEPAAPAKAQRDAHIVIVQYAEVDGALDQQNCYTLDTRTFELSTPQRGKVRLTPLQYDLLYHLITHPGETFTPARLLDEIWDFPVGKGSPDLVRVHIKTLRERIENDPHNPSFIRTIPGQGYTVGQRPSGERRPDGHDKITSRTASNPTQPPTTQPRS